MEWIIAPGSLYTGECVLHKTLFGHMSTYAVWGPKDFCPL